MELRANGITSTAVGFGFTSSIKTHQRSKRPRSHWADSGGLIPQFGSLPGVVRTRVGYSSGTTIGPDTATSATMPKPSKSTTIRQSPFDALFAVFWVKSQSGFGRCGDASTCRLFFTTTKHNTRRHLAAKDAGLCAQPNAAYRNCPNWAILSRRSIPSEIFSAILRWFERVYEADLSRSGGVHRFNGCHARERLCWWLRFMADQLAEEIALLGLSADKQRLLRKVYGHFHQIIDKTQPFCWVWCYYCGACERLFGTSVCNLATITQEENKKNDSNVRR